MDNIPDDMLCLLLSFIPFESNNWFNVKQVCKRFYEISKTAMDPSMFDDYGLRISCQNGFLKSVEFLLEDKRVNPAVRNNKPIRLACKNGYHEIVGLLVEDERVDPTVNDNYCIKIATDSDIGNGYYYYFTRVIEKLLSRLDLDFGIFKLYIDVKIKHTHYFRPPMAVQFISWDKNEKLLDLIFLHLEIFLTVSYDESIDLINSNMHIVTDYLTWRRRNNISCNGYRAVNKLLIASEGIRNDFFMRLLDFKEARLNSITAARVAIQYGNIELLDVIWNHPNTFYDLKNTKRIYRLIEFMVNKESWISLEKLLSNEKFTNIKEICLFTINSLKKKGKKDLLEKLSAHKRVRSVMESSLHNTRFTSDWNVSKKQKIVEN